MRIVSLIPSATEIVALLGMADNLVGRSHECDFPPALAAAVLTAQNMPTVGDEPGQATPSQIDSQVSSAMSQSSPLYRLDTAALRDLRPDIIITQDLCAVCSIDLPAVRAVAEALGREGHPTTVLSLDPHTLEAVLDDILTVGDALGVPDRAQTAVAALRERMHAGAEFMTPFVEPTSVLFMEWTDPVYCGGHWTPQLIERAGGSHPFNPTVPKPGAGAAIGPQQAERIAGKSVRVPIEVIQRIDPDAIIIAPCGLTLDQTRQQANALLEGRSSQGDWFKDLTAVKRGRVALVDGNQMFNRPGPRLIDAFEWLVGSLNDRPEIIPKDFPWEPFDTSTLRA